MFHVNFLSKGDSFHKMSNPVFWGNKKKSHQFDIFSRGEANNFIKMKPANKISKISAEAQHFLHVRPAFV